MGLSARRPAAAQTREPQGRYRVVHPPHLKTFRIRVMTQGTLARRAPSIASTATRWFYVNASSFVCLLARQVHCRRSIGRETRMSQSTGRGLPMVTCAVERGTRKVSDLSQRFRLEILLDDFRRTVVSNYALSPLSA